MESNEVKKTDKIELDKVTEDVLKVIDSYGFKQEGAYNLRLNGMAVCHGDSRHINIVKKEDKPGIDIHISGEAKNEQVHIPVVMSKEGVDIVYNDFYIEDGADVTIIAGCGIHGEGCSETRHDGIHAFHVGKNANVKYVENHFECVAPTREEALKGPFRRIKSRRLTEIARYNKGEWSL